MAGLVYSTSMCHCLCMHACLLACRCMYSCWHVHMRVCIWFLATIFQPWFLSYALSTRPVHTYTHTQGAQAGMEWYRKELKIREELQGEMHPRTQQARRMFTSLLDAKLQVCTPVMHTAHVPFLLWCFNAILPCIYVCKTHIHTHSLSLSHATYTHLAECKVASMHSFNAHSRCSSFPMCSFRVLYVCMQHTHTHTQTRFTCYSPIIVATASNKSTIDAIFCFGGTVQAERRDA